MGDALITRQRHSRVCDCFEKRNPNFDNFSWCGRNSYKRRRSWGGTFDGVFEHCDVHLGRLHGMTFGCIIGEDVAVKRYDQFLVSFDALGILNSGGNHAEHILAALEDTILGSVHKKGAGEFTLSGLLKIGVQQVPAKKKRFGKDPFTGEERWFDAKPATVRLKVRALKKLKDAAA
ncbi:HU family DNA-binding protein [Paraburkholderia sp. SIMBA_054]|uniref:HU family DNA-binding protein n=1 Tax=Paraburkholderia sp. SIMBA_054 TaxID=3085795 RepID=UPI00397B6D56